MWASRQKGLGRNIVIVYLIAVACSAALSPYAATVIGYWILLAGSALLTMGLVQRTRTINDLVFLEKTWLITVSLIVLVNTVTGLLYRDGRQEYEVLRLGMSTIHAAYLGYTACFAFCVSFMKKELRSQGFLWTLRIFLLFIILASRTRVPIMICVVALFVALSVRISLSFKIPDVLSRVFFSSLFGVVLTLAVLAFLFDLPGAYESFEWFNRSDPSSIFTLTGRTEIWSQTTKILFDDPMRTLLGFGYGISRLILNDNSGALSYFASHTHNGFLEHFFGMGLVGLIPYVALVLYSIKWLTASQERRSQFSAGFVLRAHSVMLAFYIASLFEVPLGSKITPIGILIVFYVIALDKGRSFSQEATLLKANEQREDQFSNRYPLAQNE
jgi:O-antigen ligase